MAHNSGGTTPRPIWTFTTVPAAPRVPSAPSPAPDATNISLTPTLTWTAAGATSYDVQFGTTTPPPSVSTGQPTATYTPAPLSTTTTYYWQVVARNSGGTTPGPIWTVTTVPAAPGAPASPSPATGATTVSLTPTLT